ncbi:hypothetical protein B8W66_14680 [Mycobacterium decipiens]|uniref:Uncharacterized protein n=1 Tax=Mycobacterium decipiens TaxID=1430326 RepID=A0A1X2LUT4_9MYCO|nr:hypothetical protein B8W66_14680 [Mycobacterium decipiens]
MPTPRCTFLAGPARRRARIGAHREPAELRGSGAIGANHERSISHAMLALAVHHTTLQAALAWQM